MLSFDFSDVQLKDGRMKDALLEMAQFYRSISFDSIFKYLRQDAGLPATGEAFTGWYANDRGMTTMGQWISAFCRLYAVSGEQRDKDRAIAMMEEFWKLHDLLEKTEKPIFTERTFYSLEKIVQALIDYKLYLGIECKDRVRLLIGHAQKVWITDRKFGDNSTEWYTVGEAFRRAAAVFDLPEAREVAKKYEYREFWDLFANGKDPYSVRPKAGLYSEFCHAYSHVNSLNSCAMAYRDTGDAYYLRALEGFYQFMQNEQVMCTGGYGAECEHLMPKDRIIQALRTGTDSFETQCDTYAAFRICGRLTEFQGNAKYSDWVERLIFNAALATIPMTPEGKVLYYSNYNMNDAYKKNRDDNWTCCTGTRPLLMLEMLRLLYFHDNKGLYVSQYAPSSVRWRHLGRTVTLEQATSFPYTDIAELTLTLSGDGPMTFTLGLRKPSWLANTMRLEVNGELAEAFTAEKGWLLLHRSWHSGDRITVTLPQQVWMDALDKKRNAPNAFLHGPVALAAYYDKPRPPILPGTVRAFPEHMKPVPGKPLHFNVEGTGYIHFKPFMEFAEGEHYALYFDTGVHASANVPIFYPGGGEVEDPGSPVVI